MRSATPGRKFCTKTSARRDQREQQLEAARLAEIEHQRALVAIERAEDRGELPARAADLADQIAGARRLDLDHVGALIGEHGGGQRAGHHRRQVDDADPVEGAGHAEPPCDPAEGSPGDSNTPSDSAERLQAPGDRRAACPCAPARARARRPRAGPGPCGARPCAAATGHSRRSARAAFRSSRRLGTVISCRRFSIASKIASVTICGGAFLRLEGDRLVFLVPDLGVDRARDHERRVHVRALRDRSRGRA